MTSKEGQRKGERSMRRSPKQGITECVRPFKAPRLVITEDSPLITETFIDVISETAKARDSETIQDEEPISAAPMNRVPSDGQTPCIGE